MADEMRAALVRLLPRLKRFGIALTGSQTDADELVQDTCERAMRRGEQLRDGSRLDAWLFGIMRSRWTDEIRWRRSLKHESIESVDDHVSIDGERAVESRMTLAAVREALAGLPSD